MLVLDISNNNADADWARLAKAGIKTVFLKASEGVSFTDRTFAPRRAEARRAGFHVGAYHFARPDSSGAIAQARHFAAAVGKVGPDDLRPVLDFEASSHLRPSELVAWAREWNQEVKRLLGVLPLFYTYSAYAHMLAAREPIGAGLWLADYSRNDGREHPASVPAPWRKMVAHQFSSNCYVGGCSGRVDLSDAPSLRPLLAHPVKHVLEHFVPTPLTWGQIRKNRES